ncbi:immunoglobulin-like domain-containing protein [Gorillibacterium sp. sgz5001074]|uniref:immunoglobulin-like domain-containing protein n=1 Tax=Gorillibacterium sp. sgz5001074 TaxID=3446695 RepID=UPI003F6696ED
MKKKIVFCTAALSLMLAGSAYAKQPDDMQKHQNKKTGLENALERGNKNDKAREAIRRALERKEERSHHEEWTDTQRVAADWAKLSVTYGASDSKDSVTRALALPVAGAHGSTITWASSNPTVLSDDGLEVNRPAAGQPDAAVTLTATVTYGSVSKTKVFTVTVKAETNDAQRVAADKAVLAITYKTGDTAASVTGPLTLPVLGSNGTVITWVSSNPSVISHDGKTVNRPAAGAGDASVTLTATVTYGSVTDTKSFPVIVKASYTDAERVASDKANLSITLTEPDTAASVTKPLTLPATGTNGSKVIWISSNTAVISHDGKTVTRPAAGSGDATVVLTAVLTSGSVSDTKSFTLTVKQQLTEAQKAAADKESLAVGFAAGDSASCVTRALSLPAAGGNGSAVTWFSSNPAVISNDGKTVVRPAAGQGDVNVVLNATITSGGYTELKTFTLTVKQQLTDAQAVEADKAALALTFASGDSAAQVTQNLTLPLTGTNGTAITWVSSNTSVISNSGAVTRPAAGSAEVSVVLTAILTKGGLADTKAFIVTVKPLP